MWSFFQYYQKTFVIYLNFFIKAFRSKPTEAAAINPQARVAQKIADEVVFRHFKGEEVEFF